MAVKKPVKKTTKKKTTSKKPATKKTLSKKPKKKFVDFQSIWQPLGSSGTRYGGTYDAFQSEADPTPIDLALSFANEAYACATFIAHSIADIEIKLAAETRAGQSSPKVLHGELNKKGLKWYQKKAYQVHEIFEHEVLDLLAKPNPSTSYPELIVSTQLYLDIVGRAFWFVAKDEVGLPVQIDVLPAHLITTKYDEKTGELLGYMLGDGKDGKFYRPDTEAYKVVAFRNYEYFDLAHGEGVSPLKAVWQKVQLSSKELSSWEIIVTQMAQPLVMLSPKDPEIPMSADNAERLGKEYTARFFQSGKGGVFVNSDAVDVQPISWPPRDQAGLALQDVLKSAVCNAYHLPRALLDMQDVAQANGNNSITLYQRHCLKPRISRLLGKVNIELVKMFDERLYLVAEDIIGKDEALEIQKEQVAIAAYTSGLASKNEVRVRIGLPPIQGGEQFVQASTGPGLTPLQLLQSQDKKAKGFDPADKYKAYPLKPVVSVLQKWFGIQKEYVLGRSKSATVLTKSKEDWVDLSQFDREMAEDLYPAVQAYYDQAGKTLVTRLGLTSDVWDVVQPKIKEAVRGAVFQFAKSTNETTSLDLNEARKRLREGLEEGLVAGETVVSLTERVNEIFENATQERAWLIADSERTRAINDAELMTAEESGVVSGKAWLSDAMACPVCKELDGITRQIDEPYFVDKKGGPYAVKQSPPAHPGCRCSQTYVLKE